MAGRNLHNAYLDTQVKTASKDQLLMMLFDGAIRFAHQAKTGIENRDIQLTATNAVKVQNIINELMGSLDKDMISPELYSNLMSLYAFVHKRMVSANVERSAVACDEAIEILHKLRGIWKEAVDKVLSENGGKLPPMQPMAPAPKPIAPLGSQPPAVSNTSATYTGARTSQPARPAGPPVPAMAPRVAASATPLPAGAPSQNGQKFPLPQPTAVAAAAARPSQPAPAMPPRPAQPAAGMPARPGAPAAPAPAAPPSGMRPKINLGKK